MKETSLNAKEQLQLCLSLVKDFPRKIHDVFGAERALQRRVQRNSKSLLATDDDIAVMQTEISKSLSKKRLTTLGYNVLIGFCAIGAATAQQFSILMTAFVLFGVLLAISWVAHSVLGFQTVQFLAEGFEPLDKSEHAVHLSELARKSEAVREYIHAVKQIRSLRVMDAMLAKELAYAEKILIDRQALANEITKAKVELDAY